MTRLASSSFKLIFLSIINILNHNKGTKCQSAEVNSGDVLLMVSDVVESLDSRSVQPLVN